MADVKHDAQCERGPSGYVGIWCGCRERALEGQLEIALGALADIGLSDDMDEPTRRNKAQRIYREIREKLKE